MKEQKQVTEQLKELIAKAVVACFPGQKISANEIFLEHPMVEEHGDYSTNVALQLAKDVKTNPVELANKVVQWIDQNRSDYSFLKQVSVAGPGFINFFFSDDYLKEQVKIIKSLGENFGNSSSKKSIVIETVSPNINKPLHIGHLRNAALGISAAQTYQKLGWKVTKDEINNDRGLHIMKAAYGYLLFGRKDGDENVVNWRDLLAEWTKKPESWVTFKDSPKTKPDQFVGNYYVQGEKFLEANKEVAEANFSEMLQAWEDEEKDVWKLWKAMTDWVHEGIDQTYRRFGVSHDKKWYEHKLYKEGRTIILEGLEKGAFEKLPDGAVQANLEKFGLQNKILLRRDGTSIYMTFDIALTKHKVEEFKADKYVWIVGSDQIDHFKRLFAIFELLGLGKVENFYHLAYGMVRLPGGKMSSRQGNVVLGDDLLDEMKKLTVKLMDERKIGLDLTKEEKEKIAEAVGVGSVKYTMLKVNPMIDVTFDLEKSVSLEGDSGPYLQYTYARARSLLRKAKETKPKAKSGVTGNLTPEELTIMSYLYRFPEIMEQAAMAFSPNLICSYLFELAKRFNNLYNNVQILSSDRQDFLLDLTEATSIVMKSGLNLLGIEALEKM